MNKNIKRPLATAFAATILLIAGCKKDLVFITPGAEKQTSAYSSFSEWQKSRPLPTQFFTLDASKGGTICGDRGYTFTFRPGTLVDRSNKPIEGAVDIQLLEVTNAYEMMASGAGTWATNGILASVGMFSLNISQNGQEVFVNRSQPIQSMVTANPNASMAGIELFRGAIDTTLGILLEDLGVRWQVQASSGFNADTLRDVWDSIQKRYVKRRCIRFNLNFLKWCNLDKYINNADGQKIVVEIPGINGHTDTKVYMYFEEENLKGMVPMFDETKAAVHAKIYTSRHYNLPLDWKIRIIVVTRDKKGTLLYETRIITNTKGAVHEFKDLKSISDEDLEAFFRGL
jgi:hypothetical protein